jgi:hypothetical protein
MPIVMVAVDYDPLALGSVAGLARPGGNITGIFFQQPELTGKHLEFFKEVLPDLRQVAVVWDAVSADQFHAAQEAARLLGVQVHSLELRRPSAYDVEGAVAAAAQGGAEAQPDQQALALANELGKRPLQAHCHRGLGTLYHRTGQSEQARAELSTAIEMYREMAMTFWLPETEAALTEMEGW